MARKIFLLAASLILLSAPGVFANTIDLVDGAYPGYKQTAPDGTIWGVIDVAPTGTGIFEPFLRYQAQGNAITETGLNTDAKNPGVYDDVGSIHTHSVLWSNVGTLIANPGNTFGIPAGSYLQLTQDFNEPNNDTRFLSIDFFKIYAGNAPDLTVAGTNMVLVYDAAGMPVLTDYTLASSGSGEADIEVFIPLSNIASFDSATYPYFYLFTGSGDAGTIDGRNYAADDGFEEWRILTGKAQVPEPSALLLLGGGLAFLGVIRRRTCQK